MDWTGAVTDVHVRQDVVDARYLEPEIPATHVPSFGIDPGVRLVPVNALADVADPATGYTIVGGGKTAMDACVWLLCQVSIPIASVGSGRGIRGSSIAATSSRSTSFRS